MAFGPTPAIRNGTDNLLIQTCHSVVASLGWRSTAKNSLVHTPMNYLTWPISTTVTILQ
jgi:hypothetical protein